MVRLYLIRHGECAGKGLYIGGGSDVPLVPEGIEQIRGIASLLQARGADPRIIYTSQQIRAVESSAILGDQFKITPKLLAGLEECRFGEWEGLSYEEILKRDEQFLKEWIDNPFQHRPAAGESLKDVEVRVNKAAVEWEPLIDERKTHEVFIVSHRGPLALLLLKYLKMERDKFWSFRINRGSVSRLDLHPGFSELVYLNLTAVP